MQRTDSELPSLTVAVVVYNSPLPLLAKTLQSLALAVKESLANTLGRVDLTVIDNGSEPTYSEQLAQQLDGLQTIAGFSISLIKLPQNLGFGAGHNRGFQASCGDYHLVLNPDVEVHSQALNRAISRLENDISVALISPFSRGGDGQQEFLCKRYPSVLVLTLRAFAPGLGRRLFPTQLARYEMSDVCNDSQELSVPLASGCFMLVRGQLLRDSGGFDEGYFLYFEDFDLSLRLASFGKLLYLPSVRIVHHGGYAASKGWRHLKMFASSGLRFFRQHGWRWTG